MKKLMLILVKFATWFVSLFISKKVMAPIIEAKESLEEKFEKEKKKNPERDWGGFGRRKFVGPPPHNNRKQTRGRHIQYVNGKAIYHDNK